MFERYPSSRLNAGWDRGPRRSRMRSRETIVTSSTAALYRTAPPRWSKSAGAPPHAGTLVPRIQHKSNHGGVNTFGALAAGKEPRLQSRETVARQNPCACTNRQIPPPISACRPHPRRTDQHTAQETEPNAQSRPRAPSSHPRMPENIRPQRVEIRASFPGPTAATTTMGVDLRAAPKAPPLAPPLDLKA